MHSIYLLALFPLAAVATLNGHCSGTATGSYKDKGICVTTATCSDYSGSYISGGCPNDPSAVRCCLVGLGGSVSVNPCGGSSFCDWTSNTCGGSRKSGYCPGGDNYKCCKN